MITFEEAKAIVLENHPEIDLYTEYENAYVFSSTEYANLIGPMPLVVMKETGQLFGMIDAPHNLGDELGPARLFTGEVLDFLSEESD